MRRPAAPASAAQEVLAAWSCRLGGPHYATCCPAGCCPCMRCASCAWTATTCSPWWTRQPSPSLGAAPSRRQAASPRRTGDPPTQPTWGSTAPSPLHRTLPAAATGASTQMPACEVRRGGVPIHPHSCGAACLWCSARQMAGCTLAHSQCLQGADACQRPPPAELRSVSGRQTSCTGGVGKPSRFFSW